MEKTIPNLFESSSKKFSNNPLIYEKKSGKYSPTTFQEIRTEVHNLAGGLMDLGLKKDDKVILLSEGRKEWLTSEMALLYLGAVVVPLSIKLNEPSDIKFRIEHSESRYAIASARQAEKLRGILNDIPSFKKLILLDDSEVLKENEVKYSDLLIKGNKTDDQQIINIIKEIKQDDVAVISYTSGTTADPKGIMLTHRNFTANVEQAESLFDIPEWYTTLLILPWDHSFAHTVGLYTIILNGASISVVDPGKSGLDTLRNIPINIKETRPVFLLSVPALASNFRKNIEAGIIQKGEKAHKLFKHAMKLAYAYNKEGHNKGSGLTIFYKPLLALYDKILFSKIREGFGGRLKFFVGGGALLDIELQRFFYALDMPMYQGYGLTEAAPIISSNSPKDHKLGTSGKPVDKLEVKILDDKGNELPQGEKGEIVVKGENVMAGYWKNENATYESIHKGWLHTGDMGYFDEDGYLMVLGRFKSLLISNDGEKYSPEGIEEAIIQQSKYIDQCMLYNNQDSYTVGLVVANQAAINSLIKTSGLEPASKEAIDLALLTIKEEIKKYFKGGEFESMFPKRWLPAAIGILPEAFSEENRMINSTMKMVRNNVVHNYKDIIHLLFTPVGKEINNEMNLSNMKIFLNNSNS
ncbi:MAG: long-chain fatty acid--CoA ligase [Marinilabiliales bacterium]|nr:MAG: long-chain fatty acid--CoA ligase [Marinilabiliales bacterium]